MEFIQKQVDEFEGDVRKNASTVHEFCRERGMSPIETGAACNWLVQCIKQAIFECEKNPITND